MRSIRTTNNARRRAEQRTVRRRIVARMLRLSGTIDLADDDCGQCLGTGTIEGGLSGDGPDEECPVCDGSGILPDRDP